MSNPEATINRMKQALGLEGKSDAELARHLDMSSSALSQWKRKGEVPSPQIINVATKAGVSIDWLANGTTVESADDNGGFVVKQIASFGRSIDPAIVELAVLQLLYYKGRRGKTLNDMPVPELSAGLASYYENAIIRIDEILATGLMNREEAIAALKHRFGRSDVTPEKRREGN